MAEARYDTTVWGLIPVNYFLKNRPRFFLMSAMNLRVLKNLRYITV